MRNQDDIRARVLDHAIQYVDSVGLSLGDSASIMQQLAADVGITNRQFVQVWPTSDDFFMDLFIELANQARIDRADSNTLLNTWQYLSMRTSDLSSLEGRRSVLVDIIRTAAEYNFDVVTGSNKWRTYAALSTTIMSWPDVDARTRVLDSLRASELAFIETMESFYRNVLPTIGYRLKPQFNNDFQPFVVAAASVIEGLGIVRSTVPAIVETHFDLPADGGAEAWSVASLAFMGVIDAFIEPDPEFDLPEAVSRLSTGVDVTPQSPADQSAP